MSSAPPLELERPRDLGELLTTTLSLYWRNLGTLLLIAAAVVVPVDLIVLGAGMEQLFSEYDEEPPVEQLIVPGFVGGLVTTPLISAMTVHVLLDLAEGREPQARSAIQRGLEIFTAIFLALLLALGGITLGFLLLIVPGVYLTIRWYFVTQSVVVDGARGADALRRSGELVKGSWWRVLGVLIVASLIAAIPAFFIGTPLAGAAAVSDVAALALLGQMAGEIVTAPFVVVMMTLVYFDLRWRHRSAQMPQPVSAPPDPPGLPPRE